jgi:hypothetical protein
MTRWLLTGAVASVAWGGSAAGQAPRPAAVPAAPVAPAATDGRPGDGVYLMRTAGQPDRRVKVVRSDRMPDGVVLTQVKDIATGEVYTILDDRPDAEAPAVAPVAAAPRPTTPTPVHAAKDTKAAALPRAKDRSADPLLGHRVTSGKTPPAAAPRPGQVAWKPVQPAHPQTPAARPVPPPAHPAAAVPPPPPEQPAVLPPPAAEPVQVAATVAAEVSEETIRAEVAQYVRDLHGHARAAFRMEAATGLADARYAAREEVRRALAKAAVEDPAGAVRGHCIDCLSQLGYADPEYVRRLGLWADDPEPAVRRAAREALAKLAPKS